MSVRHIRRCGRVASAIVVFGLALVLPLPVAQESYRRLPPLPVRFKSGVTLTPFSPLLDKILATTNAVHWALTGEPATVTSLNDGFHPAGSLHYHYRAADFRTRHLQTEQCQQFARLVQAALGPEFAILLESDPPHLHVSYRLGSLEPLVGVRREQEVSRVYAEEAWAASNIPTIE